MLQIGKGCGDGGSGSPPSEASLLKLNVVEKTQSSGPLRVFLSSSSAVRMEMQINRKTQQRGASAFTPTPALHPEMGGSAHMPGWVRIKGGHLVGLGRPMACWTSHLLHTQTLHTCLDPEHTWVLHPQVPCPHGLPAHAH